VTCAAAEAGRGGPVPFAPRGGRPRPARDEGARSRSARSGGHSAMLGRVLIVAGLAVRDVWAESGTVDGGSAALFPYAGFFESDKPIVCMLPPGTRVEKLDEAPLVDGAGAVIAAKYFFKVDVLEGDCKGRVGWITRTHYAGRPANR
jgi:hypothetical protein